MVDYKRAKYFERLFANDVGNRDNLRFRFRRRFVVDPTLTAGCKTNCVGFVCSFYEFHKASVQKHSFPEYSNPYNYPKPTRDFPSPGHLAHALRLNPNKHPYCPENRAEAEKYATAMLVLKEETASP